MSKYKRQVTEEEIRDQMIENGEMDEEGNLLEANKEDLEEGNKDEIDWKKRHDDGRRYQIQLQSKNKELESRLLDLEKQLNEKVSVPDNIEEFEEWAAEYPKVAEMVRIAARREAAQLDESVKERLTGLDVLEKKNRMLEQKDRLRALQPDFYSEIAPTEEFRDWVLNKAPEWAREAIFNEDNPNAEIVSTVIDSYKLQTGWKSNAKPDKKTTSNDAASSVKSSSSSAPKAKQSSEWSESRVNRMNIHEYEKYEDEINTAIQNGTFVYDMSHAQ